MQTAQLIAQWIVGLGILNVWFLRSGRASSYRGGNAKTMKEEFAVYGLAPWFMYAVGTLKVALALTLIAGTWKSGLVQPAAAGMAALMAGAAVMHMKVRDTILKMLPALAMLVLSLFLAVVG